MQNEHIKRVETTSAEELKGYKNLQVMDLTDLFQEDFVEMVKGREELQGYELEFTSTKETSGFPFYPVDHHNYNKDFIEMILRGNGEEIKQHRYFSYFLKALAKVIVQEVESAIENSGVKEVSKITIISAPQETIMTVGTEGKPVYVQVVIGDFGAGKPKAVIQTEMSFKVQVE